MADYNYKSHLDTSTSREKFQEFLIPNFETNLNSIPAIPRPEAEPISRRALREGLHSEAGQTPIERANRLQEVQKVRALYQVSQHIQAMRDSFLASSMTTTQSPESQPNNLLQGPWPDSAPAQPQEFEKAA